MILFLLLLIVAGALVGLYAVQNTATHDVTLWQWHWSAVPDWVPVVLTAAVIGALFLPAWSMASVSDRCAAESRPGRPRSTICR